MIFIDRSKINLPKEWIAEANLLLEDLKAVRPEERSEFINGARRRTWNDPRVLEALRAVVGNKCWYSEVHLDGNDPNVDHFRPKGAVREIDDKFQTLKVSTEGYWWWAFEWRNFRLAAVHANQRRIDKSTSGGKADFFPVYGARAAELLDYDLCVEYAVPLDPCRRTDVALIWFDADGIPSCARWKAMSQNEEFRVRLSIWLYHLDKDELVKRRKSYMDEIRTDVLNANTDYLIWQSDPTNIGLRNSFERQLDVIKRKISDESVFSGARRTVVHSEAANCPWILAYELA